jgi:hypothetical protein
MSADFSFLTLRKLTAYQADGARVPQNYILQTSTNGAGGFTNALTISSVNTSTLNASTLNAPTAILSAEYISTLYPSTIIDDSGSRGTTGQLLSAGPGGNVRWINPGGGGGGGVDTVNSGYNILVNNSDPANPIINLVSTLSVSTVTASTISSVRILDGAGGPGTLGQILVSGGSNVTWSTINIGASIPNGVSNSDYLFYSTGTGWTVGSTKVRIGFAAGLNQLDNTVAIGSQAGQTDQQATAIAIGYQAGRSQQQNSAIAIGQDSGETTQETYAIAIGNLAGNTSQSTTSIALGYQAGRNSQGANAIAIGKEAGATNQGQNTIAIGYQAGINSQSTNTIVLNASTSALNTISTNALYIKPIRNEPVNTNNILQYNTVTNEITYTAPSNALTVSTLTASTISSLAILDRDGLTGTTSQILTAGTGGQLLWSTLTIAPAAPLAAPVAPGGVVDAVVPGSNITVNSTINTAYPIVNLNSTIIVSTLTTSTISSLTILDRTGQRGTTSQVLTAGSGGQVLWSTFTIAPAGGVVDAVVPGNNITVNSTINTAYPIVNLNSTIIVSTLTTSTISSLTILDRTGQSGTDSQVLTAGTGGQVVWRTISGSNNSLLGSQAYYSGTSTISIGTIAGGATGTFAVVISGCGGGGGGGAGAWSGEMGPTYVPPQAGGGGGGAGDGGTYTVYCAHTDTLTVTVGAGGAFGQAPASNASGNPGGKGGDTSVRFSNSVAGLYFYGGAGGGGGILNSAGGAGGSGAFAGAGGGSPAQPPAAPGTAGGISGTSFKSPFTATVAAPTSGWGGNGVSSGAFSGGGGGQAGNNNGYYFGGGGGGGASLFADGGRGGSNGTVANPSLKYNPDSGGFGAGAGGGAGYHSKAGNIAAVQAGATGGAGFVRIDVYKY